MSGSGSARQTGTVTVATGTSTHTGLSAPARTTHPATRISSDFRLVGAPIGCRDFRVLDRTEPNCLAPRRVVAADFSLPGLSARHCPGVGTSRRWVSGSCIRGQLRGRPHRRGNRRGDR